MKPPGLGAGTGSRVSWVLLLGIALTSFALISYEISLTRVLSVLLTSTYVFLVVSLALLGIGLGAAACYFVRTRNRELKPLVLAPPTSAFFALSLPASVFIMAALASSTTGSSLAVYALIITVPFILAGVFYSEIFRGLTKAGNLLYGLDLIGASAGALGVVLILDRFGAEIGISLLGLISAIGAGLIAMGVLANGAKRLALPGLAVVVLLSLASMQVAGIVKLDLPVGMNPEKESFQMLHDSQEPGRVLETRKGAFGRTDLIETPSVPDVLSLFIDGGAGSGMYRFSGDITNAGPAVESLTYGFSGYLPLSVTPSAAKNNALIIGPGGGRDVLVALLGGVKNITAVEVNPQVVDIVKEYRDFNGGLYTSLPNVSVVVDEGRNFLRRQTEKYDLIMLSIPVTKTSRSIEGFAQTENYLFTVESIQDYFDHLSPQGQLVVVGHNPVEATRLMSTAVSALEARGLNAAAVMSRAYVIGSHHNPAFVLKKTPLDTAQAEAVHRAIHEQGYDPSSSYIPDIKLVSTTSHEGGARYLECASLDRGYILLDTGKANFADLTSYARKQGLDLSPVTDNRPFYYKTDVRMPPSVSAALWSSLAALAVILAAAFWRRKSLPPSKRIVSSSDRLHLLLPLFALIGAGFMLIEVSAIQRLTLFLGQPVLATAVTLFSILASAGVGSLLSGRVSAEKTGRAIALSCLIVALLIGIYTTIFPAVVNSLPSIGLAGRISITALLMAPLGFIMGMPFALGLRLLKERGMEQYVPYAWAVNGISSVLGSSLAVSVALAFGFSQAMLVAALAYGVAAALMFLGTNLGTAVPARAR